MKFRKKLSLMFGLGVLALILSSCSNFENWELSMRSKIGSLPLTVSTYDSNGQKIDQITAKSVNIHTDNKMSQKDDNGKENSSVIDVDYGHNRMIHVGSTLIAYEGIKNYQDTFSKHVKINDQNHAVPVLNTMYQNFKNDWKGDSKVVMIRSQLGMPVAVFAGKNVSIHKSDMKNSTQFVIDGHRLFVYRADYTIYPIASLKK
ncbi:DUF5052 family protein [uncultured Lactobacillus sp.]|uniref:DUF5052 family protein n=1 Tax=uncultured Lactobacillus sp. TaxID=153152 RepID=UPI00280491E8|nr:DUF5052 family protein [uncultured Lactobacillus sp.]